MPVAPHVLVVDDNTEVRAMLCAALGEAGFVTADAGGAREALMFALAQRFDAFVVDLVMPGTNGLQLLRELRAAPGLGAVPGVLLSSLPLGATRDNARADAARFGLLAFVDKPVTGARLVAALGALLAGD